MSDLNWLQDWYSSMCDADWEHQRGIEINTIDNPGWHVLIPLRGVELEQPELKAEREGEEDWFTCKVHEKSFEAFGGSKNLNDILAVFREWVEQAQEKEVEVNK